MRIEKKKIKLVCRYIVNTNTNTYRCHQYNTYKAQSNVTMPIDGFFDVLLLGWQLSFPLLLPLPLFSFPLPLPPPLPSRSVKNLPAYVHERHSGSLVIQPRHTKFAHGNIASPSMVTQPFQYGNIALYFKLIISPLSNGIIAITHSSYHYSFDNAAATYLMN